MAQGVKDGEGKSLLLSFNSLSSTQLSITLNNGTIIPAFGLG